MGMPSESNPPPLPQTPKPVETFEDRMRGATMQIFFWLKGHKWQAVPILCALIISGTAFFIYQDQKSEQQKRDQAAAQKEAAAAEELSRESQAAYEAQQRQAKRKAAYEAAQEQLEQGNKRVADQIANWNQLVQRHEAERQAENLEYAMDDVRRQNQEAISELRQMRQNQVFQQLQNQQAISELSQMRQNQEFQSWQRSPQSPEPWILRYNSFANQWQYAPQNAVLKYNAFQNRWEFVPQ